MPNPFPVYPGRVVARKGLASQVGALEDGELGWDTDKKVARYGDASGTPARVMTDKSDGQFDFSGTVDKVTLPGGLVFDATKAGQINGVTISSLNQLSGLLVRRGDNQFAAATLNSSDGTLTITSPAGETNNINIRINPDSVILRGIIQGYVDDALDALEATQFHWGDTPPSSPRLGTFWLDTDDATLYLYCSDGTTRLWLDLNN